MLALLIVALQAATTTPPTAVAPTAKPKQICEWQHVIGTIRSRRVCRTPDQINFDQTKNRNDLERIQQQFHERERFDTPAIGPQPAGGGPG